MISETTKQPMAWMEHGLQTSLERYELSMQDKMVAAVLGALRIMGDADTSLLTYCYLSFVFQGDTGPRGYAGADGEVGDRVGPLRSLTVSLCCDRLLFFRFSFFELPI